MRIVGIETSGTRGSVALLDGGRLVAHRAQAEPGQHAERVLTLLGECLEEAAWSRKDLQRIAVGIGPGSFTGLRVGIALAQGLALGLDIPLVGVGSLAALAAAARPFAGGKATCPILDARREEVFVGLYAADGTELLAPHTLPVATAGAKLREALTGQPFIGVGSMAHQVLGSGDCVPLERAAFVDAEFVASLASDLAPPDEVTPMYARDADAVLPNLPKNPLHS